MGKLGLSKLTMKLLLVTAATAAIALAAPYNPYSAYNLSPIPSYYYAPYNTISGGVPSTAYATYSNLYSPYNTVSYSNQVPTATKSKRLLLLLLLSRQAHPRHRSPSQIQLDLTTSFLLGHNTLATTLESSLTKWPSFLQPPQPSPTWSPTSVTATSAL